MIGFVTAVLSTGQAAEVARPPFQSASVRYRNLYVQYGNPPGCRWLRLGEVPSLATHPQIDSFRPGPFYMHEQKPQVGVSFGEGTSWHIPMMASWSRRSMERSQGAIDQLNALVLTCEPIALSQAAWQKRLGTAKRWERQFYMTYWVQYAHLVTDRHNQTAWSPWVLGEACVRNREHCDAFLDKAYDHLTPTPEPESTP
jgi:hypothetical protein